MAKGDEKSSKVVGRAIKNIKLPPGTTIGAIVRGSEVLIAHSNTLIYEEDHVILFLVNKRYIGDVEKLFTEHLLIPKTKFGDSYIFSEEFLKKCAKKLENKVR